ncbi:MAG: GntR family transcriptional regulator [Chitinivibrionales bacterium]|nr:GntR family transcriptional regulator [Chitinivibrionales bacterium]
MNTSPPLQNAFNYLQNRIADRGARPGHSKLPSIAAMAQECGVALTTMAKAVGVYRDRGVVSCVRGYGIFINPPLNEESGLPGQREQPSEPLLSPWRRIKKCIEMNVLNGVYPPGTALPTAKELRLKYRTSFQTLRKALGALVAEGILEPLRRGYAVPLLSSQNRNTKIVLLEPVSLYGEMILRPGVDEEFVHRLENECARRNVGLEIIGVQMEKDKLRYINLADHSSMHLENCGNTMGFIYAAKMQPPRYQYDNVLSTLFLFKKPVAILDMLGGQNLPSFALQSPRFRQFTVSVTAACARHVAKYLLELGHYNIAYISPFHKLDWSVKRYDGLVRIFRTAGHERGVSLYALSRFSRRLEFGMVAREREGMPWFQPTREQLEKLPYPFRHQMLPRMQEEILYRYVDGEIYSQCVPLFEKALRNKAITAWVTANDPVAAMALDFLKKNNISVPGRISIISFDDSIDALRERISSYNFNISSAVQAMLDFVLSPTNEKRFHSRRPVDIKGNIIERQTTQKVNG